MTEEMKEKEDMKIINSFVYDICTRILEIPEPKIRIKDPAESGAAEVSISSSGKTLFIDHYTGLTEALFYAIARELRRPWVVEATESNSDDDYFSRKKVNDNIIDLFPNSYNQIDTDLEMEEDEEFGFEYEYHDDISYKNLIQQLYEVDYCTFGYVILKYLLQIDADDYIRQEIKKQDLLDIIYLHEEEVLNQLSADITDDSVAEYSEDWKTIFSED